MRYLFLFGLIVVSVLAVAVDAGNSNSRQKKSNQVNVNHRHKSIKPANLANAHHHRSKPVARQRKAVAKSHRNLAKKQHANKKIRGVLVTRNGKRQRAVVKSKPRRKAVRAIRKITRRVNRKNVRGSRRVKPSSRVKLSRKVKSIRRRSNQRKRLAKQEEADIESSEQEGFGEEQQSVDGGSTGSETSSSSSTSSGDLPAADQPVSTPEEPTSDAAAPAPAPVDTTNQAASPQIPANVPSNFNDITKSSPAGKNAVGVGYASNSNGPAVAFGYATSVNGQNTAGGFGASFSAPELAAAQPDSSSTQQEGSTDELAQYRRPRRNNRRQDKYRG